MKKKLQLKTDGPPHFPVQVAAYKQQLEQLQASHGKLQSEVSRLQAENLKLTTTAAGAENGTDKVTAQLEAVAAARHRLEKELAATKDKLSNKETEVDRLAKENERLTEKVGWLALR